MVGMDTFEIIKFGWLASLASCVCAGRCAIVGAKESWLDGEGYVCRDGYNRRYQIDATCIIGVVCRWLCDGGSE